jgi:hypothetical protein
MNPYNYECVTIQWFANKWRRFGMHLLQVVALQYFPFYEMVTEKKVAGYLTQELPSLAVSYSAVTQHIFVTNKPTTGPHPMLVKSS